MKQLFIFIRKEFLHVMRDRKTLLILFGLPIVQILIFGFALTNEVKNSRIAVIDLSKDEVTQNIINRIDASKYFEVQKNASNIDEVEQLFRQGKIKTSIIFEPYFSKQLIHEKKATVQIIADASDPNTASTLISYLQSILMEEQSAFNVGNTAPIRITPQVRMLYNPQLKGVHNYVPGVMALVLMLVCVMMTAISIVKEKETGTMEVLLVSPLQPALLIISKAIPYLILSWINVISILTLSVLVLDLPIHGSLLLLFGESTLFIITCLSLGIFISIKTESQQVAMLISLMGLLLPTMLFSGFMFPIENMPIPLQVISNAVPAKWYYIIVKAIMIKGLGFSAIWKETLIMLGITLFLFLISIRNFKIRLA